MKNSVCSSQNEDMEALFDSIVRQNSESKEGIAPGVCSSPGHHETKECQTEQRVLLRVGQITRVLHDSLQALGYDKMIERTAAAIPDARDRLTYVADLTERAAERTLNATDTARPIQEKLAADAGVVSEEWRRLFARELSLDQFKELVENTRSFLDQVPAQTQATNAQLMEIMMAQDFQDLTGQVIKKITVIIQSLEQDLLQLLLDNIPPERRIESTGSLVNGPVVNTTGRNDVVDSQVQVDELLESLGF